MNAFTPGLSPALQRLGEVSVRLSVELGRTNMALRDVLSLNEGSVVSLDRLTDELLEITANGQVIAFGEVIAQDGKFALRIVSLASGDAPAPVPPPARPQSCPQPPMPDGSIPGAQVSGAQMPGMAMPDTPTSDASAADAAQQTDATPDPVAEQASEAPSEEAAEASADGDDIDELAAALDDALGEAPPAPTEEEAENDPLADALADLPEPPSDGDEGDAQSQEASE